MTKELTVEEAIKQARKWAFSSRQPIIRDEEDIWDVVTILLHELDRLNKTVKYLSPELTKMQSQLTLADKLAENEQAASDEFYNQLHSHDDPDWSKVRSLIDKADESAEAYKESRK